MTREELRAQVAAQVAESRVAQGFPPGITDPEFLAKLAARVADGMLARAVDHPDGGGPPVRPAAASRARAARRRSEGGRPYPGAPSVPEKPLSVQRGHGPVPPAATARRKEST